MHKHMCAHVCMNLHVCSHECLCVHVQGLQQAELTA